MAENNDWIKAAFDKAADDIPFDNPEEEAEYQAYKRTVIHDSDIIMQSCGMQVGLGKMNDLSKVIIDYKMEKTLSEFIKAISTLCFHIGFTEGRRTAK